MIPNALKKKVVFLFPNEEEVFPYFTFKVTDVTKEAVKCVLLQTQRAESVSFWVKSIGSFSEDLKVGQKFSLTLNEIKAISEDYVLRLANDKYIAAIDHQIKKLEKLKAKVNKLR